MSAYRVFLERVEDDMVIVEAESVREAEEKALDEVVFGSDWEVHSVELVQVGDDDE